MATTAQPSHAAQRIVFIDVIRAYAILMMLQGHFIDTVLMPAYRDHSLPAYAWWAFFRGMTAPIFFFSTGLVFVYLLLRSGQSLRENARVKKGLRRGLFLIGVGYLLRVYIPGLFAFKLFDTFFQIDVLHCIGLSLILLVGLYALSSYLRLPYHWVLLATGLTIFFVHPIAESTDWSFLPKALENYFSKRNGSVFTPVPWMGFACLGGVFGRLLTVHPSWSRAWWLPVALLGIGMALHYYSTDALYGLANLTGIQNFETMAQGNWMLWEFGHVLIAVAIIITLTRIWQPIPPLVTKIGSETLTIYAVHFVVLYGSWFGIGIYRFFKHSLLPYEAAIGALAFVLAFVVLIRFIEPIRALIDQWLVNPLERLAARASQACWALLPDRWQAFFDRTKET